MLGTGNTTRLTSLDFGCPNLALPAQNTKVPQDFGDAPASYGDPAHDIVAGWRIGATNTAEAARYNSSTASGDASDDGVTLPPLLRRSTAGTVAVVVAAAGTGGRLQAWVDWNGYGSFADAGEQVATNIADNGTGDTDPVTGRIAFALIPPATAVLTPTFARFRWLWTTGLMNTSVASNGEVEDYQVTVYGPAVLGMTKTSALAIAPTPGYAFSVPGVDMIYTITGSNTGTGPTDANSVFLVDTLPATLSFVTDFDDTGPGTEAVAFSQAGAGLTWAPSTDLRFSNLAAIPASMAACTYVPTGPIDANVRHVCFNPKGAMLSGSAVPSFTIQLRARIK